MVCFSHQQTLQQKTLTSILASRNRDDGDKRCGYLHGDSQSMVSTTKSDCSAVPAPISAALRMGKVTRAADRELLESVTSTVLDHTHQSSAGSNGPYHVMLYGHGATLSSDACCHGADVIDQSAAQAACLKPKVDRWSSQHLLDLGRRLVSSFEPNFHILSVRLLVAPPSCAAQDWHLDYRSYPDLHTQTVFVAMTPCVEDNCTEMLMPVNEAASRRLDHEVARVLQPDVASGEQCSGSDASQSVCARRVQCPAKDFHLRSLLLDRFDVACVATSMLPHRRGETFAATQTRVVLNIDFTTCSADALLKTGFVDDDAVTAMEFEGVVGQHIVDDLHSEVVVDVVA
eukprot:TRINITY_DN11992_c0_g1_i1.p1 TRINITY_DN11992_c0_g1~~TRINITY_DN11992_c0_g1_i1.p1  ORF type:complete len:344 (-),score=40.86 TRINITY_DN11992_c0_g1_i1:80-1111(-)